MQNKFIRMADRSLFVTIAFLLSACHCGCGDEAGTPAQSLAKWSVNSARANLVRAALALGQAIPSDEVERLLQDHSDASVPSLIDAASKLGFECDLRHCSFTDFCATESTVAIIPVLPSKSYILSLPASGNSALRVFLDSQAPFGRLTEAEVGRSWSDEVVLLRKLPVKNSELEFESLWVEYGVVPRKSPRVTTKFRFHNTTQRSLVFSNVKPSCACIKSNWPRLPIESGQSGEIELTFGAVSNRDNGVFQHTANVYIDGEPKPRVLFVSGSVERALLVSPQSLNLGNVVYGTPKTGHLFFRKQGNVIDPEIGPVIGDKTELEVSHVNIGEYLAKDGPVQNVSTSESQIIFAVTANCPQFSSTPRDFTETLQFRTNVAGFEMMSLTCTGRFVPPVNCVPNTARFQTESPSEGLRVYQCRLVLDPAEHQNFDVLSVEGIPELEFWVTEPDGILRRNLRLRFQTSAEWMPPADSKLRIRIHTPNYAEQYWDLDVPVTWQR